MKTTGSVTNLKLSGGCGSPSLFNDRTAYFFVLHYIIVGMNRQFILTKCVRGKGILRLDIEYDLLPVLAAGLILLPSAKMRREPRTKNALWSPELSQKLCSCEMYATRIKASTPVRHTFVWRSASPRRQR